MKKMETTSERTDHLAKQRILIVPGLHVHVNEIFHLL